MSCRPFVLSVLSILLAVLSFSASATIPSSQIVGSTPGAFEVSQSGAATYTVPIKLPPAVGGMVPNLSLRYSSQSGNGILGLGWQLNGISYITRCSTNYERDGRIDGVNFDENDQFCLGGSRLIPVDGVNGQPGTEYRTEVDTYNKVVSYGATVSGPSYFKVWSKDGTISEYGVTDDSRIEAQNGKGVIVWALNKKQGRSDNAYTVGYEETTVDGEWRIDRINLNVNSTDNTYVQFNYEPRTDIRKRYYSGGFFRSSKLLSNLQIWVDGEADLIRQYNFTYRAKENDFDRSTLSNLVECDASYNCLPEVSLDWQGKEDGYDDAIGKGLAETIPSVYIKLTRDVDGDGLSDLVWMYSGASGLWGYTAIGKGDGTFFSAEGGRLRSGNFGSDDAYVEEIADIDGDGFLDLIWMHSGGGGLAAYTAIGNGDGSFKPATGSTLRTGNFGSYSYYEKRVGDLDGDGLTDLIWMHSGSTGFAAYTALGNGDGTFQSVKGRTLRSGNFGSLGYYHELIGDLNGDGLTDLIWVHSGPTGLAAYTALGNGDGSFQSATGRRLSSVNFGSNGAYQNKTGDLNGDGITDLIWMHSGGGGLAAYTAIGIGDGSFQDPIRGVLKSGDYGSYDYYEKRIGDIDGDGLTDLIWMHSGPTGLAAHTAIGNGDGSFQEPTGRRLSDEDFGAYSSHQKLTADLNGNGLIDLAWLTSQNGYKIYTSLKKKTYLGRSGLVTQISSANSNISIKYSPLTNSVTYTKQLSSNDSYPVVQTQPTSYVVNQVESSNGIGGLNATTYRYEGLKYHTTARKSLGFAKITTTDLTTGNSVQKTFSQDYDNRTHGMLEQEIVKASNGVDLLATYYNLTVSKWNLGAGEGYIYSPYADRIIKKSKDHAGILTNDTQIDITKSSDGFGNLKTRTERNFTAGNTIPDFTEAFTYKPADTTNWFISQVATHVQESGDKTRSTHFTNYDTLGRLTNLTIEPSDDPLFVSYGYDDFGNIETTTESATNIATRTTTTNFDVTGLYVNNALNAEGFTDFTVESYDIRFGQPTSILDANNQRTQITYDDLGRIVWQKNPDNTELTVNYQWCSAAGTSCETNELYLETVTVSGQAPVTRYFDIFNRELRNKHIGFDDAPIYQQFAFNEVGGISSASEPYRSSPSYFTTTEYDSFWRPFKTINPDDDNSYREITQFNGSEITERNERGYTKTTKYDPLGRVLKTTDANYTDTDFVYGAFGSLEQTLVEGTYSLIEYDNRGRKTEMTSDANAAVDTGAPSYKYTYNSLGEMVAQEDPNGAVTCYVYDKLGRMTKRVDNYQGSITTQSIEACTYSSILQKVNEWSYDSAVKGKGLLHTVEGPNNYLKTYGYDSTSRLESETTKFGSSTQPYTIGYGYNATNGFQDLTLYPENFATLKQFKPTGYFKSVIDADNPSKDAYYQVTNMTVRDQVSHFSYGNGLSSVNDYYDDTGRLESTESKIGTVGTSVLDMYYQWDVRGNLSNRQDIKRNNAESFTYDNLDRIRWSLYTNSENVTTSTFMYYSDNGNISYKPGVGTYSYDGIDSRCIGQTNVASRFSDYAVRSISGTKSAYFCYDNNGNTLIGDGRTMMYNTNNQPTKITKGTDISDLLYDPEGSLYQRTDTKGSSSTQTTYVGGIYEKEVKGTTTKHKFYVEGVAVVTQTGSNVASRADTYLHHDHLGSVVLVTDQSRNEVESFSFDAWGKRRGVVDYAFSSTLDDMITTQLGFTGHQQMDNVGLIHMKGRVYDPTIGRFLSQDPYVQDPTNSQSYNRYSYVWNRVLSATDPTGYLTLSSGGDSVSNNKDADGDGSSHKTGRNRPNSGDNSSSRQGGVGSNGAGPNGSFGGANGSLDAGIAGTGLSGFDAMHMGLDGLATSEMPGVSQVSGLVSAIIYGVKGDYVGAGSSIAGMIPGIGAGADAARMSKWAVVLVAAKALSKKGPAKFDVGSYKDLKGTVSGLDAHHAGQKSVMKKLVDGYDPATAPTILVPKVGHTIKGPNGIVSRSAKGMDSPRKLLARDIRELRRVYPDVPNSQLQKLISMNKEMYPTAFIK